MSVWSNTPECRVRTIPCSKCWVCLKTRGGRLRLSCDSESEAPVHFARSPRAAPWLIKSSSLNIKHHNKVKQNCCLEIVRQGTSFEEWFSTERLSPFPAPKREMSFSRPVFVKPSQCNESRNQATVMQEKFHLKILKQDRQCLSLACLSSALSLFLSLSLPLSLSL